MAASPSATVWAMETDAKRGRTIAQHKPLSLLRRISIMTKAMQRAAQLIFAALTIACTISGSASAATRPADCTLIVDGKSYISGVCEFAHTDSDGSFSIYSDQYFAMVNVENGKGEAAWNGVPYATRAQAVLGDVHRNGGCWEGEKVRVCAVSIDKARHDAAVASRPKGLYISPEQADDLCASAPDYRFEPGAALVMDRCDHFLGLHQQVFHLASNDKISFDGKPGLCIDARASEGAKEPRLVLDDCAHVTVRWTYDRENKIVHSSNNLCWDVLYPDDKQREGRKAGDWSSPMIARACAKDAEKNTHFNFGHN